MFYHHEILTDRKHGVATIWLVATLGSKSSLKKITRKAIMEVDVPDACGTITAPSAPMALRLQGNLLFGVSRVFSQQCAYVLTDMQSLRDKMRGISIMLKELETDPDVAATRPEQLNLQVDPGFNIDLDLGFDLSSFDTSFSFGERSSQLSPQILASSQTSFLEDERMVGLGPSLEAFSSYDAEEGFDFDRAEPRSGAVDGQTTSKLASELAITYQPSIVEEPTFEVDEEGNIVFGDIQHNQPLDGLSPGIEMLVGTQDRLELNLDTEPTQVEETNSQEAFDDDQVFVINDDAALFGQAAAPETPAEHACPGTQQPRQSIEEVTNVGEDGEYTEAATGAAQRCKVKAKTAVVDYPTELQNRVLSEWNDNYLDFMEQANFEKAGKISMAQAKRNAAYWVLDQGIGGIDADFRADHQQHPLAIFSGQALLDTLRGSQAQIVGQKRTRSASVGVNEADEESRRTRSSPYRQDDDKAQDESVQIIANDDDEAITMAEDDIEPEIGRHEQLAMSDYHDSMPWNLYASSKQGSRQGSTRPRMSIAGASSSAGGRAGFDMLPSSMGSKRAPRLIAESPLEQRRRLLRHSSIQSGSRQAQDDTVLGGADDNLGLDLDISDTALDRELAGKIDDTDDFELYGPAAAVSTQQAADSQWLAATLEEEAFNFLSFLQTTIDGKQADLEEDDDREEITVTFEELLPSQRNSEVVAAQGLLHVLSLATKGLITVRQERDFGVIEIGILPDPAAMDGDEIQVDG